jgi:hypothetical protein
MRPRHRATCSSPRRERRRDDREGRGLIRKSGRHRDRFQFRQTDELPDDRLSDEGEFAAPRSHPTTLMVGVDGLWNWDGKRFESW